MAEVQRLSAEESRRKVQSGQAMLACAYEDEAKCAAMKLEGAISWGELRQMMPSLSRDLEIILYCA